MRALLDRSLERCRPPPTLASGTGHRPGDICFDERTNDIAAVQRDLTGGRCGLGWISLLTRRSQAEARRPPRAAPTMRLRPIDTDRPLSFIAISSRGKPLLRLAMHRPVATVDARLSPEIHVAAVKSAQDAERVVLPELIWRNRKSSSRRLDHLPAQRREAVWSVRLGAGPRAPATPPANFHRQRESGSALSCGSYRPGTVSTEPAVNRLRFDIGCLRMVIAT